MRAFPLFLVLSAVAAGQAAAPVPKAPEISPNLSVDLNRFLPTFKDAQKANKTRPTGECSIPLTEVKPVSPTAKMPILKPPREMDPKMIVPPPAPPCERSR